MSDRSTRQLAAILFTDIVGYTMMMQTDESTAIAAANRHQEAVEESVANHGGEVIQYYGDGSLSIFSNTVGAVKAAMRIQGQLRGAPVVPLRIGIHIGEISFDQGKVFGDGVNIASRIESLGQAGTVLFSRHVYDKIRNQPEFQTASLGKFEFKNVEEPLEIFALANEGFPIPRREQITGKLKQGQTQGSKRVGSLYILGLLALIIGLIWVGMQYNKWTQQASFAVPAKHYQVLLPDSIPMDIQGASPLGISAKAFDLSPDGSKLVYVGLKGGNNQLFLRDLTVGWEVRKLPGTENAYYPFFSPDGKWVAFYADKKLKKISTIEKSTNPIVLCEVALPYGAHWNEANEIFFCNNEDETLCRVSADGGVVEVLLTQQSFDSIFVHGGFEYIAPLPVKNKFLIADDDDFISIVDLVEKSKTIMPIRGNNVRYFNSGHLIYTRFGQLYALAFDIHKLEISGTPRPLSTTVKTHVAGTSQLAFAPNGCMAYVYGSYERQSRLVKVGIEGTKEYLPFPVENYGTFQLSPDGQQLAVEIATQHHDEIWIYHLQRNTSTKLTSKGNNYRIAWAPDGSTVTFLSARDGSWGIYKKEISGLKAPEKLWNGVMGPYKYSHDGQWLLGTANGIHALYFGDSIVMHELDKSFTAFGMPVIAPNDQWFCYISEETGQYEVYVQAFPPDDRRWQVSVGGGEEGLWSRSGEYLFYRNGNDWWRVPVKIEGNFEFGKPERIFSGNYINVGGHSYEVMPDAQSFIVLEAVDTISLFTEIRIVENWSNGLYSE